MAHLLYITNGLGGGLNSSFELARRLTKSGHTIAYLGHRDLSDTVEAQGYTYTRVTAADDAMATLREHLDRFGRLRSIRVAAQLRKTLVASREIEQAITSLEQSPDALLIDVEFHCAVIATRSLGIPTVIKSDWFSFAWQRGVPPMHSEMGYPTTTGERVRADLVWLKTLGRRYVSSVFGGFLPAQLLRRWAPFRYNTIEPHDLREVAAARGLKLASIATKRRWLAPYTYPELPLMSSTAKELDFVQRTTPNDQWIGPLVFREQSSRAIDAYELAAWQGFRDTNAACDRPLVYCSFGTLLPDTSAMIKQVVAVAADRPDLDLVIGLGGRDESVAVPARAKNILIMDYAPQPEVLSHASAAVIHGGINTIHDCLVHGVPMILEQSGPVDGPGNASRVDHFGVGIRTSIADLSVAELAAMIDQLMTDESLQARVTSMQQKMDAYETDRVVERFIDVFLESQA